LTACNNAELSVGAHINYDSKKIGTATGQIAMPSIVLTFRKALTQTQTQTTTLTPGVTETPVPTQTSIMIVPFLDGKVMEQASCRYGAGAAYLFEWGLYPGDNVRILNRNGDGTWVYVKPTTYNNECWVKATLLDFKGDVNNLEEYYSPLPYVYKRLYQPVRYLNVGRDGDEVVISWDPVWMTEDDDRGYLIEAWVCQDGKFKFFPISYFPYTITTAIIKDGSGCTQESHARFYTVEKHGYMPSIEISWPKFH
jgi:hypothetical protein